MLLIVIYAFVAEAYTMPFFRKRKQPINKVSPVLFATYRRVHCGSVYLVCDITDCDRLLYLNIHRFNHFFLLATDSQNT